MIFCACSVNPEQDAPDTVFVTGASNSGPFILYLAYASASRCSISSADRCTSHVLVGHLPVGNEGVVVGLLTSIDNRNLAPVDSQRTFTFNQRHVVGVAIGVPPPRICFRGLTGMVNGFYLGASQLSVVSMFSGIYVHVIFSYPMDQASREGVSDFPLRRVALSSASLK